MVHWNTISALYVSSGQTFHTPALRRPARKRGAAARARRPNVRADARSARPNAHWPPQNRSPPAASSACSAPPRLAVAALKVQPSVLVFRVATAGPRGLRAQGRRRSSLTPGGTREGRERAVREGAPVDDDVVARSPRRPDPRHRQGLVLAQARALDHDGAAPVLGAAPRARRSGERVPRPRSPPSSCASAAFGVITVASGSSSALIASIVATSTKRRPTLVLLLRLRVDRPRRRRPHRASRRARARAHGSEQARLHGVHRDESSKPASIAPDGTRAAERVAAVHADRVLRRDRRHRVRAEHAQGHAGLDLRLQARAAAAVAARDEQHLRRAQRGAARDQQQQET